MSIAHRPAGRKRGTPARWCRPSSKCPNHYGLPLLADIVAKVFLGCRTKILRAADAFYAQRREGPYRFIQNRSRTSVVALKNDAASEKPKEQLSRDFLVVRFSTFATISTRSGHSTAWTCAEKCLPSAEMVGAGIGHEATRVYQASWRR